MNTGSVKPVPAGSQTKAEALAEQRAQQRMEQANGEDSSKVGLLRITRPLDISMDDQGGDPYNSTGRFTRRED